MRGLGSSQRSETPARKNREPPRGSEPPQLLPELAGIVVPKLRQRPRPSRQQQPSQPLTEHQARPLRRDCSPRSASAFLASSSDHYHSLPSNTRFRRLREVYKLTNIGLHWAGQNAGMSLGACVPIPAIADVGRAFFVARTVGLFDHHKAVAFVEVAAAQVLDEAPEFEPVVARLRRGHQG